MVSPKKNILVFVGLVVAVLGFFPAPLLASQKNYYDWGPYYQTSQVLGFSLSTQENLPPLEIPTSLIPQQASGILPGSPFYPLERFIENTQLAFTFDPVSKANLRLDIAAERLSEAKTLMEQGKTQAATTALRDYTQTTTTLAQNLSQLSEQKALQSPELLNKLEEGMISQAVAATSLSLTASPAQAEGLNQAANSSREVLDEIAGLRGKPVISEELSQQLQKLKEQGLISEEESNKIYSLKDRSEVREELNKLTSSGVFPPSGMVRLDDSIAKRYPDIYQQQVTNLEVVELRGYQTLSQPSSEIIEELEKWQGSPGIPPSNDIKPYLWYNRAQDLAKEVDLSKFSGEQQSELVKSYPQSLSENPTYSPPPATPTPSPASTDTTTPSYDQPATTPTPATSPLPSSSPSPRVDAGAGEATPKAGEAGTPPPPNPYLQDSGGALPGQPTYILRRLGETLSSTLTFNPAQKARLRMQQAERRLAEATALSADPSKASLYELALKNYQQAVTDASTRLKNLKDEQAGRQIAEELEAQVSRHEVVLEKGFLTPPAKNPELIANAIHAAEDAMDRSADRLDRPALPPVLASRLGDLKAQGLILAEETDDLVNSSSREEVRGKIRKLLELKTFPLADAKKLDEAQTFTSPSDYNQLVEVRKVEELQNLRSTQADLAQTQTLRASLNNLSQQEAALNASIDTSSIKSEDLGGRDDLIKAYEKLSSAPRPINAGQFGPEATPGAQLNPPKPADAVLSACPEGAVFKQSEGCVWADTGRSLNDYEQYKCDGPRQYFSFAARKCVAYDAGKGWNTDAQPICPVGYNWSWQTQSCQVFTGGGSILPSPSPELEPKDDAERNERSKKCPEGSSYQAPNGCVWDNNGKSVYDSSKYRCGRGQYYSFEEQKCVASPKEGEPYPKDAAPSCKEEGAYWSWTDGKCIQAVIPQEPSQALPIDFDPKVTFVAPDSPFYFLKQTAERAQQVIAFTPQAREEASLDQAQQRLAEAIYALKKNDEEGAKKALASYTTTMQNLVGDLSKASISEMARNEISKRLGEEASEQNLLLQKISALAPASQDTAISAAVSATILGVDKAADIAGEPPIPAEVKTKIESLPKEMISEEDKKKLLEADSRVEARLNLGGLVTNGALTQTDTAFLNEDFDKADPAAKIKADELKKLEQMAKATETKEKTLEKIKTNEEIVQNLQEFEKTFEPGKEILAEVRPYVRLTRINEIAQTLRPDIVNLDAFQNRKDVILAVATLQEEFKPTKEAFKQVEDFRRKNPNTPLPPELARVEALSYSLGIRGAAGPCFLPTPPFPANTPCPAPGAAIPIASYTRYDPLYIGGLGSGGPNIGYGNIGAPSLDKDGKPLVYGQGPKTQSPGICPSGYHWMYDSGGWCMADSGSYNSSYSYTPSGTGSGYTPYSPYYNAPGAPPTTFGYPSGGGYPSSPYSYGAPSYYGPAPTSYTTYPPAGTVPGSGPKPTAPGQCPDGYHWMSDSGGWCMANGNTYVPPGTPYYPGGATTTETGSYNCGSQPYDPVTKKCKDGACPGGFNWDGSKCVAGGYSGGVGYGGGSTPWCWSASPPPGGWTSSCGSGSSWDQASCTCRPTGSSSGSGGGYSTGSSYQYGCTPGYYWDGNKCVPGSNEGGGWSDTAARSQSWCQPPAAGCGSNSYWDYGSCYCRPSSSYYGGSGPSPSNQCQGLSCGGGAWLDYSTCSCRYSGGSGTSSTGSPITCYPPSQGCPGGWYDYGTCSCKYSSSGTSSGGGSSYCSPPSGGCGSGWWDTGSCSCRQSSSQGCSNVSASSCGSGWYFDSAACTCRQSTTSGTSGSTTTSGSGSSGSCPSGYHWMSDNGGWCMQDGSGSTSSTTTSSPPPATESTPPPATESTPPPATESTPPPATESTPPPSTPSP